MSLEIEQMSFIAWLDHSEHDRRKMLDVIDLFREQDTRDELGLGAVRDAFADLFFPGTSTIQTRARYFLFVPWLYLDLERREVPALQMAEKARRAEIALIDILAESDDKQGVIGIEARRALKRLPSNVYWQGLRTWHMRAFPGSQDQYHRSIDRFYSSRQGTVRNDDGEILQGAVRGNWDGGLPPAPDEFPKTASFALRKSEAEYLRDRVQLAAPRSLLACLLEKSDIWEPVGFAWEHPDVERMPATIREQLLHARNFSEAMRGAALLYNLMLAEVGGNEELKGFYRDDLLAWSEELSKRDSELVSWDRRRFWEIVESTRARVGALTRLFINRWLEGVIPAAGAKGIAEKQTARRLIEERERSLKGEQARIDNRRALERWSGAAGTAPLNYRWNKSERIMLDILAGLRRGRANA